MTDILISIRNNSIYRNPHVIYAPHFSYGSGSIFLKNIECAGNESDIEECSHSAWGVTDCKHSEDVGIDCSKIVFILSSQTLFLE